jgi:elongation factor G
MSMAIEPKTQADRDAMTQALRALAEEDPTFRVSTDPDTGQTLISGMGELHLEIIRDRMVREYRVGANAGKPTVAYRETITAPGRAEHVFDREIAGRAQFARVVVEVSPRERGAGNRVSLNVSNALIPPEFHEAIRDGIQDGLVTGILGNYPLTDVEAALTDGSAHPVDSSEVAFRTAAVLALRDAVRRAAPTLLEPVMRLEIVAPDEHMGDVLNDINGRRGRITGLKAFEDSQIIHAEVPLAEMFGYSTSLRSLSRGRASYSMEPHSFEPVPEALANEILNQ